jgi:hypothetical protein
MGILLFMGMAINPLTLITSYYIISPWFVWIPMSQPDMRGSIDLTFFSTGMKWSENHPHNIHNQTWYNMTTVMFFFCPSFGPDFPRGPCPGRRILWSFETSLGEDASHGWTTSLLPLGNDIFRPLGRNVRKYLIGKLCA